jgi:arginyl-tRNA synthetase
LKIEKIKDIVFKPEESLRFEGNTGPYLLYTYARARSILRKAKYKPKKLQIKEINDSEKALVSKISSFPEVVAKSYEQLAPNLIANYAYELAQKFNEFYHSNKVIDSDNETLRLALVDASSQVLKNALNLLSITPLESM